MDTAIIVAVITGGMALLGTVITVRAQNAKARADTQADLAKQQQQIKADLEQQQQKIKAELAKHEEVSKTRIEALTLQVEKHNNVIERTFKLETDVDNLFHRYDETRRIADEAHKTACHAQERADASHNRIDRAGIDRA